jgi:hypothetical protein
MKSYIKDASGLAQAKGLPSLIYHEPAIEVKFMRGAAGTTRILTIRGFIALFNLTNKAHVVSIIDTTSKKAITFPENRNVFWSPVKSA